MDLTDKFSLSSLLPIQQTPLKEVKELNLLHEKLEKDVGEEIENFTFAASAEAGIHIKLFNDPNDDNEDDLAQKLNFDQHTPQHTFIHYHLEGRLKAKSNLELERIGLNFITDRTISFSNYLHHKPNDQLLTAIAEDIKALKFILNKQHVQALNKHEALSMQIRGTLELEASAQFSDALTASISAFARLLPAFGSLQLSVNPALKVGASVNISDDFQLVIQRREENDFKAFIQKVIKDEKNISSSFDISLQLLDETEVEKILEQFLQKAEETLLKEAQAILEKGLSSLSGMDQQKLKEIEESLGLSSSFSSLEELKEKFQGRKEKLKEKFVTILSSKLTAGLSYEYSKSKNKSILFEATLTPSAMDGLHEQLIRLQIGDLVKKSTEQASDKSGITLVKYQELTEINIKKSLKIGISLGNFVDIGMKDEREFSLDEEAIVEDRQHRYKINHLNIGRTYQTKGRNQQETSIQFNARMENFVSELSLATCDKFDYELSFQWSSTQKKTKEEELRQFLDLAVLWHIIPEQEFEAKYLEFQELVKEKVKEVSYRAFIKAPHQIFDAFINDLATAEDGFVARSMAAAVPYAYLEGRNSPNARIYSYHGFWLNYLKQKNNRYSKEALIEQLSMHLSGIGLKKLADFEMAGLQTFNHPYAGQTISRIIDTNWLDTRFRYFQSGFKYLWQNLHKNYQQILLNNPDFKKRIINQTNLQRDLSLRFFGRMLLDLAIRNQREEELEKAFTIEYEGKDGKKESIILGSK